jgi:hypothetical protein
MQLVNVTSTFCYHLPVEVAAQLLADRAFLSELQAVVSRLVVEKFDNLSEPRTVVNAVHSLDIHN